jgi:hypothetical protein
MQNFYNFCHLTPPPPFLYLRPRAVTSDCLGVQALFPLRYQKKSTFEDLSRHLITLYCQLLTSVSARQTGAWNQRLGRQNVTEAAAMPMQVRGDLHHGGQAQRLSQILSCLSSQSKTACRLHTVLANPAGDCSKMSSTLISSGWAWFH